jgi:hypothetical protein
MEAFFGVDLSTVRVHTSVEPEQFGALALTVGEDIHFAPGQFDPVSPEGLAILGHELTHVLQQRDLSGAVGAAPVLMIDPDLEAEADRLGRQAAAWRPGLPAAARASRVHAGGVAPAMAQPFIKMAKDTGDDPTRYGRPDYEPKLQFPGYFDKVGGQAIEGKFAPLTDFATTRANVVHALRFLFRVEDMTPKQEQILKRWMEIDQGPKRPAEMKYFHVYGELAWALTEEEALENEAGDDSLAAEREVADLVLAKGEIADLLRSLSARFRLRLLKEIAGPSAMLWAATKGKQTPYWGLHQACTYEALVEALAPANLPKDVGTLIARLHDVKDLMLRELRLFNPGTPPFVVTLDDGKVLKADRVGMRYNVGTVDESNEWVRWMRDQRRAVWAGPSYTMRYMWDAAVLVGATKREMLALGYAMYAYWCRDYPHHVTPIHRFHETFAAAQAFDLPYHPTWSVKANYTSAWESAKL